MEETFQLVPHGEFRSLENLSLSGIVGGVIVLFTILASVLFFFQLLLGGIKMMLSGGRKDKSDAAVAQILNAFIGLTIVFSIWGIVSLVGYFFGVDLMYFEIPEIQNLPVG